MKQQLAIVLSSVLFTCVLVGVYCLVARLLGFQLSSALLVPLSLAVFWIRAYSLFQRSKHK